MIAIADMTPTLTRAPFHHLILALALALLCTPTRASYQTGLDAYNAGNYTAALSEWKAIVELPPVASNPAIYAETHYAIGMLYWQGQGVSTDYLEASRWLHKAAELGHAGAQGKLGYLYSEGITVQQNYEIAFQWFHKAAKQGDIDGQYNLGIFYLNGWGTEQDKTRAAQYLAAASVQGDESAEAALQNLLAELRKSVTAAEPDLTTDERPPRESGDLPTPPESIFLPTTWILAQNPEHYTIQVIGLSTQPALEKLILGHHDLSPFATYTLQRKNRPLHLLVQGVYPDVESARKARDAFPAAIQKPKNVWIRKFGKIQELIKAEETFD